MYSERYNTLSRRCDKQEYHQCNKKLTATVLFREGIVALRLLRHTTGIVDPRRHKYNNLQQLIGDRDMTPDGQQTDGQTDVGNQRLRWASNKQKKKYGPCVMAILSIFPDAE